AARRRAGRPGAGRRIQGPVSAGGPTGKQRRNDRSAIINSNNSSIGRRTRPAGTGGRGGGRSSGSGGGGGDRPQPQSGPREAHTAPVESRAREGGPGDVRPCRGARPRGGHGGGRNVGHSSSSSSSFVGRAAAAAAAAAARRHGLQARRRRPRALPGARPGHLPRDHAPEAGGAGLSGRDRGHAGVVARAPSSLGRGCCLGEAGGGAGRRRRRGGMGAYGRDVRPGAGGVREGPKAVGLQGGPVSDPGDARRQAGDLPGSLPGRGDGVRAHQAAVGGASASGRDEGSRRRRGRETCSRVGADDALGGSRSDDDNVQHAAALVWAWRVLGHGAGTDGHDGGRGDKAQPAPLQLHVHGPGARGAVERGRRSVPQDARGGDQTQPANVRAADRGDGPLQQARYGEG
ncbi:unnamed protein product, partial [Ectocarpus fasciculatus]